jgi:hypothetical protein
MILMAPAVALGVLLAPELFAVARLARFETLGARRRKGRNDLVCRGLALGADRQDRARRRSQHFFRDRTQDEAG